MELLVVSDPHIFPVATPEARPQAPARSSRWRFPASATEPLQRPGSWAAHPDLDHKTCISPEACSQHFTTVSLWYLGFE